MTTPSGECVSDERLVAFVLGTLPAAAMAEVEEHLGGCEGCRAVLSTIDASTGGAEVTVGASDGGGPVAGEASSASFHAGSRYAVLEAGARVGHFVIQKLLGYGGMGIVYLARDDRLGREVALKLLRLNETGDLDGEARLLREARAAATIAHPNAVTIFDVGEHERVAYIAMERIEGKTLRELLRAGRFERTHAVEVLLAVARALGAAHARGVVHRDIKPENVMLRADGVAKVLDFGLARRAHGLRVEEHDPHLPTLTREGVTVGTPKYMSPEQARGEVLDARSDQFSWGVMAYELLAGKTPWDDPRGGLHVVHNLLFEEPPRLGAQVPVPEALEALVMRTLRKDAGMRFPSMDDVILALEATLDTVRNEAPPVPARRWRGARAVFAAAALVVLAAAGVAARSRPAAVVQRAAAASAKGVVRSKEAIEAYREGMQAYREGSITEALRSFERATAIDATFAAAHLRYVLLTGGESPISQHLQGAEQFRGTLDEKERALLFAFQPWASVPPDWTESEHRMQAVATRLSDDADVAYELGWVRFQRGDYRGAIAAFEGALRIDPELGAAWAQLGRAQVYDDDLKAARATFTRCIEVSSGSTTCLGALVALSSTGGECEQMESLSERLVALEPGTPDWHRSLATARLALGRGIDTTRKALDRYAALRPAAERPVENLANDTLLATLAGDFVQAERTARAWEESVAGASEELAHLDPSRTRMLIALEAGRNAEATALADAYLHRLSGWTPNDRVWSTSIYAVQVKYWSGGLSRAQMKAARQRWLDAERRRIVGTGRHDIGMLWVVGFALMSLTREDALDALDALPAYEPLYEAVNLGPNNVVGVGETYRLAGKLGVAEERLRLAAQSCEVIDYPIQTSWARLHLAETLEERGDLVEACSQYALLLGRWPKARPRSISADRARARASRLQCP